MDQALGFDLPQCQSFETPTTESTDVTKNTDAMTCDSESQPNGKQDQTGINFEELMKQSDDGHDQVFILQTDFLR